MRDELKPEEWNFSPERVQDLELEACLIYEYARESKVLRALRAVAEKAHNNDQARHKAIHEKFHEDTDPFSCVALISELGKIKTVLPYDGFGLGIAMYGVYSRRFPWQQLDATQRSRFAKLTILRPPLNRGSDFDLNMMTLSRSIQLAEGNEEDKRDIWAEFCSPSKARPEQWNIDELPSTIDGDGTELAVFRINWHAFTNPEIKTCFDKWVDCNRPPGTPEPMKRGKQKARDMRSALRNLGIVRIYHHCTLREMRRKVPEFWNTLNEPKNAKDYKDLERDLGKMRDKCFSEFHRLFPFEKKSLPIHGKTWAERRPGGTQITSI